MEDFNGLKLAVGDTVIIRDGSKDHWTVMGFDDLRFDCGVDIKNKEGHTLNRLPINLIII